MNYELSVRLKPVGAPPAVSDERHGYVAGVLQILLYSLYVLIFNYNSFIHTTSKHYS